MASYFWSYLELFTARKRSYEMVMLSQTSVCSQGVPCDHYKVSHKRLLYKLQWYGTDPLTHAWIADFLRNRTQAVVLEGETSTSVPVTSGVPQGTVLGPILFLVYINDLSEYISNSTVRLFTDDCILYRQIDSTADCQAAG